MLDYIVARLPP